ncbi:exonuclease domain-containing protein [Paraglaciecola sp. 2405UD69-4]|uniref:exonuclease domain-containing protein n=1 Tax=Paraglaciecola sp. 2405UD69-4 TaxID=3391836 RepID=UPI0039C8EF52
MLRKIKTLPEKYYLDHFNEIIHFLTQECADLLDEASQKFIRSYQELPHGAQCMFVRVVNRQSRFINIDKMIYKEIEECPLQLQTLADRGFLGKLSSKDIQGWLKELTKEQLIELLSRHHADAVKKSASKTTILEQAEQVCSINQWLTSKLADKFLVKKFEDYLAYLLFLFFGDINSGLNKFSMRDLGVLRTRTKDTKSSARFNSIVQAKSVFYYRSKVEKVKRNELDFKDYARHSKGVSVYPAVEDDCLQSAKLRDEYFYLLGKQLLSIDTPLAMEFLSASSYHKAQEKWLRELYKMGEKEKVKAELEQLIDNSLDDALLLFAEDFYQRKYHQSKLSKLTQTLREDSVELVIDELYKDKVEMGVKQYYQRQGAIAFRTENRLFNALFGLTFWQELYNLQADSIATEFDRRPKMVKDNTIYQELGEAIEQRLLMFSTPQQAIFYLTKIATQYYGQPNGMFRWNAKIMEIISIFLHAAPLQVVVKHLRAMAKNYQGLKDGYPDLMIVEQGKVRFEEVKAPGDSIRPNQFVTMNALQGAGFDVRVCRVTWSVDPMQPYVVVDIETTGGKHPQHRITEIGAVKVVNGEVVDTWTSLVNPERHISKFITKLTGINNSMVADAPLFCELADRFTDFVQGCIFVAHNVNFDYGFIKKEYQRIERKFSMPKLCTVRESRKYFPGLKSYSLANLCEHFEIPLVNHHRALCDAQATAQILNLVNERKYEFSEAIT